MRLIGCSKFEDSNFKNKTGNLFLTFLLLLFFFSSFFSSPHFFLFFFFFFSSFFSFLPFFLFLLFFFFSFFSFSLFFFCYFFKSLFYVFFHPCILRIHATIHPFIPPSSHPVNPSLARQQGCMASKLNSF